MVLSKFFCYVRLIKSLISLNIFVILNFSSQHFNALLADLVRNADLGWREVKRTLRKDHRWDLVDTLSREEKEKLFNEHIELLLRKKREKFRELLDETPEVTLTSTWKEIKRIVKEDPRYTKFASSERVRSFFFFVFAFVAIAIFF